MDQTKLETHPRSGASHGGDAVGIGGMAAQKTVARIRDAIEELGPAQRIKTRPRRQNGAQSIGLQFEFLGIGARAHRGAQLLRRIAPVSAPVSEASPAKITAPAAAFCCWRGI